MTHRSQIEAGAVEQMWHGVLDTDERCALSTRPARGALQGARHRWICRMGGAHRWWQLQILHVRRQRWVQDRHRGASSTETCNQVLLNRCIISQVHAALYRVLHDCGFACPVISAKFSSTSLSGHAVSFRPWCQDSCGRLSFTDSRELLIARDESRFDTMAGI